MKDAVMTFDVMRQVIWDMGVKAEEKGVGITQQMRFQAIAKAQDNVSFKAGIQLVVEFIKENRDTPLGKDACGYYVWEGNLKAQLKKWGL